MTTHSIGHYSRALDNQVRTLDWVRGRGRDFLRAILNADDKGRYDRTLPLWEKMLAEGETFYWSAPLGDLIQHAAATMPDDWVLTADMLPCPSGYILFEHPLKLPLDVSSEYLVKKYDLMRIVNGIRAHIVRSDKDIAAAKTALTEAEVGSKTWSEIVDVLAKDGLELINDDDPRRALELSLASQIERNADLLDELDRNEKRLDDMEAVVDMSEQRDLAALSWTIGSTGDSTFAVVFQAWVQDHRRTDGVPGVGTAWPIDFTKGQLTKKIIDDIYDDSRRDGIRENPARILAATNVFAAVLAFLKQEILVSDPHRPDRATRRRIESWRYEPVIRVVRLRRVHYRNPDDEHEPREWAYQWMVSGHWRNQYYPSLGRHQPKWIGAYVKGPEDKPLKPPRGRVFAVVR